MFDFFKKKKPVYFRTARQMILFVEDKRKKRIISYQKARPANYDFHVPQIKWKRKTQKREKKTIVLHIANGNSNENCTIEANSLAKHCGFTFVY